MQAALVKRCAVCPKDFHPRNSMQTVCSPTCARRLGPLARRAAKEDRAKVRKRLEELRPLSYWVRQAQEAFNAWIRARDALRPCVSCGRHHQGKWNAGHYLSTGARPELRFDENNVHRQCEPCNTSLGGNLILYRLELIRRIGQTEVDRLEGPHEPKRYRADDLKAITATYRAKLKAIKP